MSQHALIVPYNESFVQVECDLKLAEFLDETFSYWVPGHRYSKRYNEWVKLANGQKKRAWDGKKHLFKIGRRLIYKGLLPRVLKVLQDAKVDVQVQGLDVRRAKLTEAEAVAFVGELNLPFPPRDYQAMAFVKAIKDRRQTFLAATAAGKSLAIHMISQWHVQQGRRVMIIVPTIMLVKQMLADFTSYGCDPETIQIIKGGLDPTPTSPIVITTWQSIQKKSPRYYEDVDVIIGDEVHGFKADALINIMESATNVVYRYGFTGTLTGIEMHQLIIEGLFGAVTELVRAKELVERDLATKPKITFVMIKYPKELCGLVLTAASYQKEIEVIISNARRMEIVGDYVGNEQENTLILVERIGGHLGPLLDYLKQRYPDRTIHQVHGKVDEDEREQIRLLLQESTGHILLASYGTFQLGVNIPRLHRIVAASPSKSKVRVLQSLGRGLRKAEGKLLCEVFDIVDDFSIGEDENYTLRHFHRRRRLYSEEGFEHATVERQYFGRRREADER